MKDEQVREIIKRLIWLPIMIFLVTLAVFLFTRLVPGDPALIRAGPNATPEMIASVRHQYGYDKPVLVQYKDYMTGLFRGDFGESTIYPDEDIKDILVSRAKISAPIGFIALVLSLIVGTIIGLVAAIKKGWLDSLLINFSVSFMAIPTIIIVLFLILFFSVYLHLLPTSWSGDWTRIASLSMVIPVAALFLGSIGGFARAVRTYTMPVLESDYVIAARASGFSFWRVAFKYILRNSLLPLITGIIPAFFFVMITGSFFVETIYGIDGLGAFLVQTAFRRDYDVLMTMIVLSSALTVVSYLVTDIAYIYADPRISLSGKKK